MLSIGKEEIRNIGLDFYKLKGDMNVFKQKYSDYACYLYSMLFATLQNEKLSKELCSKLKLGKDGYYINDALITNKEINEIGKSNSIFIILSFTHHQMKLFAQLGCFA